MRPAVVLCLSCAQLLGFASARVEAQETEPAPEDAASDQAPSEQGAPEEENEAATAPAPEPYAGVAPAAFDRTTVDAAGPAISVDDERTAPDYDGLEDPTTAGEVALWFPRILLSPLYLVAEYVLRHPLRLLVSAIEENDLPALLMNFFSFGGTSTILVPTGFIDFGFRPSVGLYFRTKDFLVDGHRIVARAATGGTRWWRLSLAERFETSDERWFIQARGGFEYRPDGLFYGIGLASDEDNESGYGYWFVDAELSSEYRYFRSSALKLYASIGTVDFFDDASEEPNVRQQQMAGVFAELPPGYDTGYDVVRLGTTASLDTRPERPAPGSGVRLQGDLEYSFSLGGGPEERSSLRYGGSLVGFLDVTGWQHVISLGVWAQLIESLEGDVPFTELIDAGGTDSGGPRQDRDGAPLNGFIRGRLIGESAAALFVEYRWPVWVWLDGTLQVAVGNVFGASFAGFELDRLRLSAAIGVRTTEARDHSFDVLVGFGTDTIEQGFEVSSVRIVFGANETF
jgi:hypothetical protein